MTPNNTNPLADLEIQAQQKASERSKIERAEDLSIGEKLRMGADLYDEGMKWMILLIKAENPSYTDQQVDAEIERRKRIVRQIDEHGLYQPCGVVGPND